MAGGLSGLTATFGMFFVGVHLYHQNQYVITTERAVIPTIVNPQLVDAHIRFFKYNRTFTALNFTAKTKIDMGFEMKIDVQVYKFMSNEYRFFPITLTIDLCKALEENLFGVQNFFLCGNFTNCPFYKRTYEVCNWGPDYFKFPPNIPSGQYKLDLAFKYYSEHLFTLEWYAKLAYLKQF